MTLYINLCVAMVLAIRLLWDQGTPPQAGA